MSTAIFRVTQKSKLRIKRQNMIYGVMHELVGQGKQKAFKNIHYNVSKIECYF